MVTTAAELEAMEKFIAATTLPKIFKLNAAVTINDLLAYVDEIINGIKMKVFSDSVARARWDDLVEIRRILEKR